MNVYGILYQVSENYLVGLFGVKNFLLCDKARHFEHQINLPNNVHVFDRESYYFKIILSTFITEYEFG